MKKVIYKISLVFFSLSVFLYGCQNEISPDIDQESLPNLTLKEARLFFNEAIIKTTEKNHTSNSMIDELFNNKEARWDQAYNITLSNGQNAVRIPINVPINASDTLYWKYNDGANSKIDFNLLNYLFMYKDTSQNINTEWVTLMPDSLWLQGNRNAYLGKILVRKWDGTHLRLYEFSADGKINEFNLGTSSGQNNQRITFQTTCYEIMCAGSGGSRISGDCKNSLSCETIIIEGGTPGGGWDPWGGYGTSNNGGPTYSGGGNGTGGGSGGNNYTPQCNPNLPPGTSVNSNQLPPCIPVTGPINFPSFPMIPISYSQSEMETIIQNLNDPITGHGISLFLVENYKGSKAINAVYSHVAGENITVGEYTLAKNYDANGNLISYYAWRNADNGIEYMIKADQLTAFTQNIDYYTSAANLVYFSGQPSKSMVALMSGNYLDGLLSMWDESLRDPSYYVYAANVLIMSSTNLKPNNITYRNVTTGVSVPNYEISSHSFSQYKNLIQQKHGGSWQTVATTPQGPIQVLEVGGIKYNARPIASNPNYNLTIDYFRNGKKIGEFRFNH